MKTNRNIPQGRISKSQLESLVEHIVQGVVKEVEGAKKRWTVKLEKEQTGTAAASPVTGPNAFKKKSMPRESVTNEALGLDSSKFELVSFKNVPVGGSFKAGWVPPYYDYVKISDVEAEGTDGKKKWKSKFEPNASVGALKQNMSEKKTALESATTPDLTDDRMQGKFVDRGQIKLEGGLDYETAEQIASHHWDIFGSYGKDERGVWNFKTRGERWCCSVGMLNGQPAILSVTTTPGRLNLLVGNEAYPQLKEMTTTSGGGGSSAGTPGYQIPGAWAGGSLEKNKKHIEVLGYKLTPAGKREMKRAGDNLYEGVEKGKKECQNCGSLIDIDKPRCLKCGFINDDTPEEKKLKHGTSLQEVSGLGADFDRAQQQYDAQMPPEDDGDGIECPECGAHHGYVTDKGHSGSAYWIQMKCGHCGAEWGHDNFDALEDR